MRRCLRCDSTIAPVRIGKPRRYCQSCSPYRRAIPILSRCGTCDSTFIALTPRARYCSSECKRDLTAWVDSPPCQVCGRRGIGPGRSGKCLQCRSRENLTPCSMCGAMLYRQPSARASRTTFLCPSCRAPKRAPKRRRLRPASKLNGDRRRAAIAALVRRDGNHCALCGDPVRLEGPWRSRMDPAKPSPDHVIPWGQGGTDELANLRLTHLGCNQRRGIGRHDPPIQLALVG